MKRNIQFTIDDNLFDKLQDVPNKSGLVNGLLEKYFNVLPSEISTEELIEREQSLQDQLRQIEEKKKLSDDLIAQRKIKEQEAEKIETEGWQKQKERLALKAELRRKYTLETPRNKQTNEGFEQFLKENGYHDE